MRITQCYISKTLRKSFSFFRDRYGLGPYTDPTKPAIFFGCYRNEDVDIMGDHKALAVLVWGGSDLLTYICHPIVQKVRHVAGSSMLETKLLSQGIPHHRTNIVPVDLSPFKPTPLGDKIYAYAPEYRWGFYGGEIIDQLINKGYEIMVARDPAKLSREELALVYKQAYIGLRLTQHDGGSATVLEMGMMGRRCVYYDDMPNAIPWKTVEDVEEALSLYHLHYLTPTPEQVAKDVERYTNVGTEWLTTEFWREGPGSPFAQAAR